MTVKELKDKLKEVDEGLEVYFCDMTPLASIEVCSFPPEHSPFGLDGPFLSLIEATEETQ